MKVQELRELLSSADRVLLEKAFVESYKQFTKNKKEEVDQIIQDVLTGKDPKKEKKSVPVSFEALKAEITEFLGNAYAQNYFAPNQVIPKNQRSKWRFLVKNYVKELSKIPQESENYEESARLLTKLYLLICYACHYYIFSTENPFRSIGWEQQELFQLIVKKVFGLGYTRKNISDLLLYAATDKVSRESLPVMQEMVLLSELKTADVKYMAVEEAKKLIDERTEKLRTMGKYGSQRYELQEEVNNLCDMILMIQTSLAETESGVPYYFKTYVESDKEITLYHALDIMDWMEENEQWLYIYEYGIKKKIHPREELASEYNQRKESLRS